MSQAPSQDHINAMRVAEWHAEAALKGKTFAQVACAAMKSVLPARRLMEAGDVWFDIGEQVRDIVLATATDRPLGKHVRWDQLTEREKLDCGVLVRELHRKTARGECLR